MNHDSDKEMDLLLRRQARRGATGLPGAKDVQAKTEAARRVETSHLDADELSAYAEGALPDASRSRYASHLADCDSCRTIVTDLVLSSAVETKEERGVVAQTVEAPQRSWREWFTAIFSPPVLRYAAPALALIAFASVIFIVMRNREVTSLVTENQTNQRQDANTGAVERKDAEDAGTSTAGTSSAPPRDAQDANSNAQQNRGVAASDADATRAPQQDASAPTSSQLDGGATTDSSRAASSGPANSPAPAPPPSVQEGAETAKRAAQPLPVKTPEDTFADRAKEKKDDASLAAQNRNERDQAAPSDSASSAGGTAGGRANRSTERPSTRTFGTARSGEERQQQKTEVGTTAPSAAARSRRDAAGADDETNSGETRTVAGKRFRRQNGVWVDATYNSSRSTTRVRRGSEQYRALVADEPVIETVSNSLGGAVIVVVRGRAYHIY